MARQVGRAQRANWAQQNSYEAFPPFAAAVIVAHLRGSVQMTIDVLVGIFMLARIIHGVSYIKDKPRLRSPTWGIGFTL
jgi:uncharacterized MAPEG superfamily protein